MKLDTISSGKVPEIRLTDTDLSPEEVDIKLNYIEKVKTNRIDQLIEITNVREESEIETLEYDSVMSSFINDLFNSGEYKITIGSTSSVQQYNYMEDLENLVEFLE